MGIHPLGVLGGCFVHCIVPMKGAYVIST